MLGFATAIVLSLPAVASKSVFAQPPATGANANDEDDPLLAFRKKWGVQVRVGTVAFSPDGRSLAVGPIMDRTLRIWDVPTGKEIRRVDFEKDAIAVWPEAFTSNASYLIVRSGRISRPTQISVVDLATGKRHAEIKPIDGKIGGVVRSPDSKVLAMLEGNGLGLAGATNRISFWDVPSGQTIRSIAPGTGIDLLQIVFSPDGKTISGHGSLVGRPRTTVALREWDWRKGNELIRQQIDDVSRRGKVLSLDGKLFAGTRDNAIVLWDVSTLKELRRCEGLGDRALEVMFSPDGRLVAAHAPLQPILVWDVATGAELHRLPDKLEGIEVIRFSPDGKFLAVAFNTSVEVWDLSGVKPQKRTFEW
jgi:WD40 repeat protein